MSIYDYTANFKFRLINYASQTWHEDEYYNWTVVDSILQTAVGSTAPFAVATGAVNAYAVAYTPTQTLVTGRQYSFAANAANTGAVTLNIDGTGAKAVTYNGAALPSGLIASGAYVNVVYDGTAFLLVTPQSVTIADGSITPAKLSTGKPNWDASGNVTTAGNGNISASGTGVVSGADVLIGAKPAFRYNGAYTSAVWYEGAGAPSGALGNDGDFYIRLS